MSDQDLRSQPAAPPVHGPYVTNALELDLDLPEDMIDAAGAGQLDEISTDAPPPPADVEVDPADRRSILQARLRTVLLNLPSFFRFGNHIAGVEATDLFALNSLLGASIEGQVVKALNQQRALWDPDSDWLGYTFERQSQAFPDVRLVRRVPGGGVEVVLGIELKGWFLLAKEGKPSFRFQQTPAACADHDLLVVVPWYLDNVLSGSPVAAEPFVESARWAAEYRNYYWQHTRGAAPGSDRSIVAPVGAAPYPAKVDEVLDQAVDDAGGNFGRVARSPGLMKDFIARSNELEVLGIRIQDWHRFLRSHSDQADPDLVSERWAAHLVRVVSHRSQAKAERVAGLLRALLAALDD